MAALDGLLRELSTTHVKHLVFLGDYVNKGRESAAVIDRLISLSQHGAVTLLRGNHESVLLEALETGDLSAFLKMGGAMTIRSYLGGDVGADVFREFRGAIPMSHIDALKAMPIEYKTLEVAARHIPAERESRWRFSISAHVPVGTSPRISNRRAELDTGCGEAGGRLTAFLWPSRTYLQVNNSGVRLD